MENKHHFYAFSFTATLRLVKAGTLLAIIFLSLLVFIGGDKTAALPGAAYRYRASQCGGSDTECFKYSAEAGVYRIYRGTLNRSPESSGFSFWSDKLQSGSYSLASVAQSFLSGGEWQGKYQNISNSQFVNQTYQFVLLRNPDSSGYNYWLGQLNGGTSRGQMVASMVNSSESANVLHGSFMNYYSPPAPAAPQPSPTPTPAPSSGTTPKPASASGSTGRTSRPAPTVPSASPASASGQQITNLAVSEQNFRSALVTWNTSKPSPSKINFSTEREDLYDEVVRPEQTTSHSIQLEGDTLRAGKRYYFRITADDGSGPVTLDGEFDTKAIPVIIKVTDDEDKPIAEATILAGDREGVTDASGEATLQMPEGEQTIFAQKDDLFRELTATIELPQDENPQRITLSLTKTAVAAPPAAPKKQTVPWWAAVVVVLVVVGGGLAAFLLWRRRTRQHSGSYFGDALEAENYTADTLPTTPAEQLPPAAAPPLAAAKQEPASLSAPTEPRYLPVEDPRLPHHASLPELVGRYGTEHATETNLPDTTVPVSSAGQPIPHHTSLKDLVKTPQSEASAAPDPTVKDLPVAPAAAEPAQQLPKTSPSSEANPPDNSSLTIEH